jgi:hypothetical protein
MPEGLLTDGGTVTGTVRDNQDRQPDPTPDAPRGWTWDRRGKHWIPRQRGPVLWNEGTDARQAPGNLRVDDPDPAVRAGAGDGRDPAPGWFRPGAGPDSGEGGKLRIEDVPAQVRDDMAGMAGLVGAPVLAMLQQADPYCGTILAQSYENVIDAVLPLLCRSPKVVAYFTGDKSDWLLWGKLAMALAPFARAVMEHHVVRSVRVVREDDGSVRIERGRGEPDDGGHLVPPGAAEFSYQA